MSGAETIPPHRVWKALLTGPGTTKYWRFWCALPTNRPQVEKKWRMNTWRLIAVLACAALIAVLAIGGYGAQQGRKSLNAQDYTEIQALYARYYWIADSAPGDNWAKELFTPDATWWIGTDKGGE